MERDYRKWRSPSLGRDMEILIIGHSGTPAVVFPTGEGRFHEWEDNGMFEPIIHQLENGYNQLFCVDSIADEGYLSKKVDPYTRLMRQRQYESYIIEEIVPFIKRENPIPYLIAAGAGLGAYQALLFTLKHPDDFQKAIAMSGIYEIRPFLDDFYDQNVYYNNPVDFVPNIHDEKILEKIRNTDIHLLTFKNDPDRDQTHRMSDTLWMRFIEHELIVWDKETKNPWNVWSEMIQSSII